MKKPSIISIFYVLLGIFEIYRIVEYIYYTNITQNNLASDELLFLSIAIMIGVSIIALVNHLVFKNTHLWKNMFYVISIAFVSLTCLIGIGLSLFL